MQKNISLLLNVVLIIAVAVLYYLHFAGQAPQREETTEHDTAAGLPVFMDMPIYYVNTDTLSAHYEFAKELEKELRQKQDQSEDKFEKEAKRFEKQVMEFQENARFMTQDEGKRKQEELMAREQELAQLEQELSIRLREDQEKLNRELRERIIKYIRDSRKNRNFSYILGYSKMENNILVGHDSLDITREMLKGLNAEYEESKKNEEK